ncbi:MAG: hypothetical protein Q9M82_01205 [Mariprofundus sp.]|nr:hypothetical protein [Mariprofundus sp.]
MRFLAGMPIVMKAMLIIAVPLGIRRAGQAVHAIGVEVYDASIAAMGRDEMGRMLAGIVRLRLSLIQSNQPSREEQE